MQFRFNWILTIIVVWLAVVWLITNVATNVYWSSRISSSNNNNALLAVVAHVLCKGVFWGRHTLAHKQP